MFPLRQICNTIPIDKATLKKTANASQAMLYSKYASGNRRIYKTVIEGQVVEIKMIRSTPNTATITHNSVAKPLYIEITVINTQNRIDTQTLEVYDNPYIITNLQPNAYYTISAYTVYKSGNRYLNVFENVVRTLFEGPPREEIKITNPEYDSAVLSFKTAIGVPTSINLTVLNNANTSERFFYSSISSPFLITGLAPNVLYDVSLSSFYSQTQNSYSAEYKSAMFQTYNENYPVFLGVTNITHVGATITFRYTGYPLKNIITVTNVKIPTNIVTITDTIMNNNNNNVTSVTFDTLPIDSSFNLTITSIYTDTRYTGQHTYPKDISNVFHTLNENPIPEMKESDILKVLGDYLRIKYTQAPGNVLSYDITLVQVDNNGQIVPNGQTIHYNYTTVPLFIEFPYLAVFTKYRLTIRSNYIGNRSYLYTYPTNITTLNQGPISNLTYSNLENTTVTVSFTPAPGEGQTYNVIYRGQRNNITVYFINDLQVPTFNLTGLSIFTPYYFTISSFYDDGNSYKYTYTNPVDNALFITFNENSSTILQVDPSSNYINIQFRNVFGTPKLYTLFAKNALLGQNISETYDSNADRGVTITIPGLTPSTAYMISMETKYETSTRSRTYETIYSGNPVTTLSSLS